MQAFDFYPSCISGLTKITPFYSPDNRGYFTKVFEKSIYAAHGIHISAQEQIYSYSQKGVLRGLHFQASHSQDKLVHVVHGAVFDVAVDLRANSPAFGKWEGFYLSAENRQALYIPQGFAHGFLSLKEGTVFCYLCGHPFDPETNGGIRWDDPEIAVEWPLEKIGGQGRLVLSEKDKYLCTFAEFMGIGSAGYKSGRF